MSLDYLTLEQKPTIQLKDSDGNTQTCIDLLPTTCPGTFSDYLHGKKCIVNKYYVARPDLISLAFYGTDKYADVICKMNGISNPFELNEDDMLDIPPLEQVEFYVTTASASDLIDDSSSIGQTRVTTQKSVTTKRSPGEQVAGDTNYIIDRTLGLVFY